ncbi:hypothetical protein SBDP1_580064 [Syntrophobacter sp. SbD1]|nr:hypothetical protein SBDP1_580064 [Syntrophobacter sp. SbD1]
MSIVPMVASPTSSETSNLSLTGMGTGIDWQSMLNQLTQVSEESLTPYNNQITTLNTEASAWSSFSSQLSTLKTAANTLASPTALDLYSTNETSDSSTSASSLLTSSASSTAGIGSYQVVINNTAQAEKLASGSFSSQSSALNITGAILVNGHEVQIASTDSLQNLEANINNLDTGTKPSGVTAAIVQDTPTTYRLVLTSDSTGASGISLLDAATTDTLGTLGFNGTGTVLKNQVAGGAQSDGLSSSSMGVAATLGISSLSGNVSINGVSVNLDLSDSLTTIASDINSAFQTAGYTNNPASVVSTTNGSTTTYNLQIAGMTSYTDQSNVLQALGLVQGNRADVVGVTGSVANTTDGKTPITAATDITSIYGYNTWTSGDKITLSGTAHDGSAVGPTDFAITQTTTVQDLLNQIQTTFGSGVTASVNSNGSIQVVDSATGASQLSVNLQTSLAGPSGSNAGVLNFGSFGQVGTVHSYVLQQGADAAFTVDGMSMTSASNTATNAISGVTLNLLGADPNTTVTVSVNHDDQSIETEVNAMINAYNGVISYVNGQMTYNSSTNTTGGPLFGNNALESIKSQLESSTLSQVGTGSLQYLSQAGITAGQNGTLSLDTATFESALSSNFQDVAALFSDSGSSTDSNFQYVANSSSTQSGTYNVSVSQLPGTGQNIVGQIDGENATGQGNVLTLDDSTSGANGLSISYTGTTAPASAPFTVSRGIASLMNSLVNGFTDSVNGTVTTQEAGLQTNITALKTQVTNMQNNINSQTAMMQQEFINMDTAVAQLDQMQSYLTVQLANL